MSGLDNEAGGHRIQRIPPTEKRGRVHTSTATVAVLADNITVDKKLLQRDETDFKVEWFSGTGAGGQHRNKCQNSARVIHIPTGLMESRQSRSRESNLRDAKEALLERLDQAVIRDKQNQTSKLKKSQVGSGMRGDKIRTYRFQDDQVNDHMTNKKASCAKVMKGFFDLLWN